MENYRESYVREKAKNPDQAMKYARCMFYSYLAPWRNRPLPTISRENVRELHAKIAKDHGVTANRTITFLRTLFGHCLHPDIALWNGVNPCAKPKKFLAVESGRDRTLEKSEYRAFFPELQSRKT